jgi:predicted dehydrogenase
MATRTATRDLKITSSKRNRKIRYAVVGLGHIAQVAVLPAFAHARANSQLTALVSDDAQKRKTLGRRYQVDHLFSYREYDECLRSGIVDAVYIALPNHLHARYSIRAARAGIHVLCEKPMAVTERECSAMIRAAERAGIKLMIAYRLHFEESNMMAVKLVRSGKLGMPRIFTSAFAMQVRPDNIRTDKDKGGGTLYDIGIYCINAARYLFGAEPTEVFAFSSANKKDPRFKEIDEMTSAILRFPNDRLAVFTSSFGAADVASYRVVGTKGDVRLEQAYEYVYPIDLYTTIDGKTRKQTFPKRDQFAPELIYFSDCILNDKRPEPSGEEGIADVRIIEALYRSTKRRRPIKIEPVPRKQRPSIKQTTRRPAVEKPALVHTESAAL